MIRLDTNNFLRLSSEMKRLGSILDTMSGLGSANRTEEQKAQDARLIGSYKPFLLEIGFQISCAQLDRICTKCISAETLSNREFSIMVHELNTRIYDESSLLFFFVLSKKEESFYNPSSPVFGSLFALRFATEGLFEVDEAAKCLALSRSTAAVFHLMRVMEVGIRAMSRCLGIPDPVKPAQRNWAQILRTIKEDGIDKKWPLSSNRMTGDGALFEDLLASLDAVRNPWRNSTMHVENRYTEEEAEHILIAVKGFMKKLASRCDEQGEPKA